MSQDVFWGCFGFFVCDLAEPEPGLSGLKQKEMSVLNVLSLPSNGYKESDLVMQLTASTTNSTNTSTGATIAAQQALVESCAGACILTSPCEAFAFQTNASADSEEKVWFCR